MDQKSEKYKYCGEKKSSTENWPNWFQAEEDWSGRGAWLYSAVQTRI